MAALATVRQVTTAGAAFSGLPAGALAGWARLPWPFAAEDERRGRSLDLDNQLVERCLSGEEAGWEDLVRVHTRRVYGICYRFTGVDQEAQDLTQEVFLRVFRSLKSFRAGEGCPPLAESADRSLP